MKKFVFIGFFLFNIYCFSQTEEEDAILDSIIDELFSADSLSMNLSKTNYIYTTFSFDESVFFAGRDFEINQFGFTPSISYMRGENFFVSLGSTYFSELNPAWDFVSISSGYSLFLDQKKELSLSGIYSRVFFSNNEEELNPNRISASLAFKRNNVSLRCLAGYLYGGSPSFYISTGGGYQIPIIDNNSLEISLLPQMSFLLSKQTLSEQIISGFFNIKTLQRDVFDLINTQLNFPLQLDIGNWDFQFSYNINLPKALAGETNLSPTGYLSLSVGYFSTL